MWMETAGTMSVADTDEHGTNVVEESVTMRAFAWPIGKPSMSAVQT
jgi:hypothetical protein